MFAVLSGAVLVCALSNVYRYVRDSVYRGVAVPMNFTLEHVQAVFEDRQLYGVYVNSVMVALITALAGTLIAYGGALVTARSTVSGKLKKVDRQHRPCDEHDPRHGHRSCLSVRI